MAVYKRDGTQYWHIEFEYLGSRYRRSSGTTHKRKAQEAERVFRQKLHDHQVLDRIVEMSLQEAVERYFKTVILPKGNTAAAKRDRYVLNAMVSKLGPNTPLTKLTAAIITSFRDDMLADGKAPATANRHLATLKAILNKAKNDWHAVYSVPTVSLFPLNNNRYRWLTQDEENRLLAVAPPHLKDLIVFLVDTGARKSEAVNLVWNDVDFDSRPRPVIRFFKTKSGHPRSLPMTKRVEKMLRHREKMKLPCADHVFLFRPSKKIVPQSFKQPHRAWKTACRKASLTDIVMHDLRHTFASRLVMKGVPLLAVSMLLGHADIRMTMRYAHLSPTVYDEAISVLEE